MQDSSRKKASSKKKGSGLKHECAPGVRKQIRKPQRGGGRGGHRGGPSNRGKSRGGFSNSEKQSTRRSNSKPRKQKLPAENLKDAECLKSTVTLTTNQDTDQS